MTRDFSRNFRNRIVVPFGMLHAKKRRGNNLETFKDQGIIIIVSLMELGNFLTRSVLTYPEVSSKVYPDSFCQRDSSISLPWVIYFEACYLHVLSSFSLIPVICSKLELFLTPL